MKLLLVLLVVFVGVWIWRNNRINAQMNKERKSGTPPSRGADTARQIMVSCAHCGLHLPQTEALAAPGTDATHPLWFCSAEHRQLGAKPGAQAG